MKKTKAIEKEKIRVPISSMFSREHEKDTKDKKVKKKAKK